MNKIDPNYLGIQTIKTSGFASVPQLSKFFQAKQPRENFYKPVAIEVELTGLCNLHCRECGIIQDVKQATFGLETGLIIKILQEASRLGIFAYSLTGGEPFLRLQDTLKIIKAVDNLDCYKIQTNGTVFVTDKGRKVLESLKQAGFGVKNKYLKSSLRCSVGIQDRANKRIGSRIKNLADNFYKVFDSAQADLTFVITHGYDDNSVEVKRDFIKKNFNSILPDKRVHFRALPIHSTYENTQNDERPEKLADLLADSEGWDCFDNTCVDTPWPKLLIRANGDVYGCPSFAHVFKLGNIKRDSLKSIISNANKNQIFKIVYQHGLQGLLREAQKINGSIGDKILPASAYSCYCQICKILRAEITKTKKTIKVDTGKSKKGAPVDLSGLEYNYGLLVKELQGRGAKIEMIDDSGLAQMQSGNKRELLFNLTLSRSTYTSAWIASDKFYSKKFLELIGIPTPRGRVFSLAEQSAALAYATKLGFPVVVKPLIGSHGDYVYSQIESLSELKNILNSLFDDYLDEDFFLIEEHIEGKEYRLFVTSKGFFATVNRIPASLTGDGKSTVQDLIESENFRRMNPRKNCLCTIKIDGVMKSFLAKHGLSLAYIPKQGEQIKLRHSSNVCMGGNCLDVTDLVHPSVKKFAFSILKNLNGLEILGIDLICSDIGQSLAGQKHGVCELNCAPGLSLHTVPEVGKFRNTPKAVADLII